MAPSTAVERPDAVAAPPSDPALGAGLCANCLRLMEELKAAQARIEALEAKLRDLEAGLRRSRRQAAPFSRDQK